MITASSETGNTVMQYQYDSFGTVVVDGPDVAQYKFSGKERSGSLYYFGACFYDPEVSHSFPWYSI
jgi:hypothetical protein